MEAQRISPHKKSPSLPIEWRGEQFEVFAARGLYWPREQTLIIADAHFGKAAAFRKAGIPVPAGTTGENLARVEGLLVQTGAARLLVLGDFWHARSGRAAGTLSQLAAWREQRSALEIVLVRGNHDRQAGDPPREWNIHCVSEPHSAAPFLFCHHPPSDSAEAPVLAGHVHPEVVLYGAGRSRLKAACFWFGESLGLLPAFGGFTGGSVVEPRAGDQVIAIGDDDLVSISTESTTEHIGRGRFRGRPR